MCYSYLFKKKQEQNLLDQLNNPQNVRFEIIRTKDLVKGTKYRVLDFFMMTTKYGNKVVATLNGNKKYFLPPGYAATIKKSAKCPEDIDCTGLFLIKEGNKDNKFKTPILKFIKDDEYESDDEDELGEDEVDKDGDGYNIENVVKVNKLKSSVKVDSVANVNNVELII